MNKQIYEDKKKLLRRQEHPIVPARLEGVVRNAKFKNIKKQKKPHVVL